MTEEPALQPETGGRGDRAALDRLLGLPEMDWLVARVRARLLDAGNEPLRGVVQLKAPTAAQRSAAVRLVGPPKRTGAALRVDLALVEEILRRGPWPAGLADAVLVLRGPVVDRRAERAQEAAAWAAARDGLAPVAARYPGFAAWWHEWCAAGGLKRIARAEAGRTSTTLSPVIGADLVGRVAGVLDLLPASGEPLPVLARRAVGDAHGLDASRPLGRLAAAVVRAAFAPDAEDAEPSTRDVWATAGVVLSNVASTVLCLGVPGAPAADDDAADDTVGQTARTATAAALRALRAARVPLLLTLDQVRSGGVRPLLRDAVIHVCENPTVVEVVAERWARSAATAGSSGAGGPVLVCTGGQPSTAVVELLAVLADEGAECRYHGDFDWAGLRIAQSLRAHVAWVPWRFTTTDYRAAVADGTSSVPLTGSPAATPWDPELSDAMAAHGVAVEEEAVADLLATDLLARR